MSTSPAIAFSVPTDNRLLAALPRAEYERLAPYLERLHLPRGKVLFEAGDHIRHAHFPMNGVISLLGMTEDGETVDVAVVGTEGMLGIPIILRVGIALHRSVVHIPADAVRIRSDVLEMEFSRNGKLQELLLRFTHSLLAQVSQSAICNRFHAVDARLGRWLLVIDDRAGKETFYLTQESIAQMLGTLRTVVTVAANKLQDAGFIRYRRGKITILNRQGLESVACECYRVVTDELDRFIAA
jgi:CRP-like cAMP-binding protein